jgi:hypothetical protein
LINISTGDFALFMKKINSEERHDSDFHLLMVISFVDEGEIQFRSFALKEELV